MYMCIWRWVGFGFSDGHSFVVRIVFNHHTSRSFFEIVDTET